MADSRTIHRSFIIAFGTGFALLFATARASSHAVPGTFTLHDLCRTADVIAVARVTYVAPKAPNSKGLPPIDAQIVEMLREGDATKPIVRFLPHKHAGEDYRVGEELLLFLEQTRSKEKTLEAPYEAINPVDERIVLQPDQRAVWIDAARAYVKLGKGPRNSTDPSELGRLTISMLTSPEAKIANLALRDLMLAGASPIVTASDVPALLGIVDDASRPAMLRAGLLGELERRKMTPVGTRWVQLLDSAPANDRSVVISAAKSRWFIPEVTGKLVSIVEHGKADEAIAAARAVGAEGNEAAVETLVHAVGKEPAELRFAALGSLRRIGSRRAKDELSSFATSHADPETRKVAVGELSRFPLTNQPGKLDAASSVMTNKTRWIVFGSIVGLVVVAFAVLMRRQTSKRASRS